MREKSEEQIKKRNRFVTITLSFHFFAFQFPFFLPIENCRFMFSFRQAYIEDEE